MAGYRTRELSVDTWPEYEDLFTRGNGWDFCACMYFHRGQHLPRSVAPTRSEAGVINRADKRALVEAGQAHGVLVYDDEAVGWCQFGPAHELPGLSETPRFGRLYLGPDPIEGAGPLWRITCFVIDKGHRRRGVARIALRAALDAIRRQGGGLVEAMPRTQSPPSGAHGGYLDMFLDEGFSTSVVHPNGTAVVRRRV